MNNSHNRQIIHNRCQVKNKLSNKFNKTKNKNSHMMILPNWKDYCAHIVLRVWFMRKDKENRR